jgi:t-SNARE complex subunit (syntaxin)
LPAKGDSETHNLFEGIRGSASAELGDVQDVHKRLKKLEEEISSVQDMLREVLSKL